MEKAKIVIFFICPCERHDQMEQIGENPKEIDRRNLKLQCIDSGNTVLLPWLLHAHPLLHLALRPPPVPTCPAPPTAVGSCPVIKSAPVAPPPGGLNGRVVCARHN